jgi:hypothetical protein
MHIPFFYALPWANFVVYVNEICLLQKCYTSFTYAVRSCMFSCILANDASCFKQIVVYIVCTIGRIILKYVIVVLRCRWETKNIYFFIHLAVKAACKQSLPARKSWTKKIPYYHSEHFELCWYIWVLSKAKENKWFCIIRAKRAKRELQNRYF